MSNEILVVDDNLDIRLLISGILKDKGFSLREAANFYEALNEIKSTVIDIALEASEKVRKRNVCSILENLP